MSKPTSTPPGNNREHYHRPVSRKNFLRFAGVSAATAVALGVYGCEDIASVTNDGGANKDLVQNSSNNEDVVHLGSGDIGILNYAYALEQLEAAFYTEALANHAHDMKSEEGRVLEDLQKHEVVHRDFFKAALGSDAIPALSVDFSSVDFSKCSEVLKTARTFEDLGVSAYNGAAHLIQDPERLLIAGKIVSVEARHAAAIRDLIGTREDDNIINENGLGLVNSPSTVLSAASAYIVTEIDASNLPQPEIDYPQS